MAKLKDKIKSKYKKIKEKFSVKNNEVYKFIKSLDTVDEGNSSLKFSKVILFALLVFSWFVLSLVYDYVQYIKALSFTNLLGLPIALISLLVIIMLVYFLISDILGVITLNQQQEFRGKTNKLIRNKDINSLKALLLGHKLVENKTKKKKLKEAFEAAKNEKEIVQAYESIILKETDKKIDSAINKYAGLSSAANLISSKAWLDFLITQIIFSRMLIDIAKIYNIKLGICSFLKLMIAGLMGVSVSAITTNVIGKIVKNIPVVGVVSDIVIPALIMKQLGLKIKYAIRPIDAKNSTTFRTDEIKLEKEVETELEKLPEVKVIK